MPSQSETQEPRGKTKAFKAPVYRSPDIPGHGAPVPPTVPLLLRLRPRMPFVYAGLALFSCTHSFSRLIFTLILCLISFDGLVLVVVSGRPLSTASGESGAPVPVEPRDVVTILSTSSVTAYALESYGTAFVGGTAIAGEATTYVYINGAGKPSMSPNPESSISGLSSSLSSFNS
jgi:hypothetical protein